jgi:hypothetical protein
MLKHMEKCPRCSGCLMMSVKIKEGLIKDVKSSEQAGTILFSCDGPMIHRYLFEPGKEMQELKAIVNENISTETGVKAKKKKKTAKSAKTQKSKKSK